MNAVVGGQQQRVCVCVCVYLCVCVCVAIHLFSRLCSFKSLCVYVFIAARVCVFVVLPTVMNSMSVCVFSVCTPVSICVVCVCVSICLGVCYITLKQPAVLSLRPTSPSVSHWPQLSKIFILFPAPQHSALHIYEAGCRPPVLDGSAAFSAEIQPLPTPPPAARFVQDLFHCCR